jgi:hypothetical protein
MTSVYLGALIFVGKTRTQKNVLKCVELLEFLSVHQHLTNLLCHCRAHCEFTRRAAIATRVSPVARRSREVEHYSISAVSEQTAN